MKYKVVILTAGTGSRLDNLTQFLNKSLVSIEDKPVISRIIDMFPLETEFVIALGYKGNTVKEFLTLCYPERKFDFAFVDKYEGEGSGVGYSLLACENYLQEPFIFCSCDTIVTEKIPAPVKNIAGFAIRENKGQYRTIKTKGNKVVEICEKANNDDNQKAYIGLSCIYDYKQFWKEMHKGKETAVNQGEVYPLKVFAKENSLYAQEFNWFDTGNKEELAKTQKYFKKENSPNILPKPDEAIWFIDDKVVKFSDNKDFISQRVKRAKLLKDFVPQILGFGLNMYMYKKADGCILSKIQDIQLFEKLLNFSLKFWEETNLNDKEKDQFINICNDFYKIKTEKRINLFYEKFKYIDNEEIINDLKYPKLSEILNSINYDWLNSGLAGRFHGDFHFENILYDEKQDKFIFLDWRQNFGGNLEIGDIYYDLAKLLHGLIICHELIAGDKYKISINNNSIKFSFERKPILIDCENYYYKWLKENNYDVKKVKVLTALIYLNIAPLHHYPYCNLLFYLGKSMLYDTLYL